MIEPWHGMGWGRDTQKQTFVWELWRYIPDHPPELVAIVGCVKLAAAWSGRRPNPGELRRSLRFGSIYGYG